MSQNVLKGTIIKVRKFKVCKCPECRRWSVTISNLAFKCKYCYKQTAYQKSNQIGLSFEMHSFDNGLIAAKAVIELNARIHTSK